DPASKMVLSHMHKAMIALNQLKIMENAVVIYRIARAPERLLFYVDTGSLPPNKSDAYVKQIATKYKNRIVYDANTGEIRDDRAHMTMLENYFIPRREGSQGTEITNLPGGQNLGE